MSIDTCSNTQKCESVCKPRVCDGCIPQDDQNMTEPVWQPGRKRSCKTLKGARHIKRLFSRDRHPRLFVIPVTLL